MTKYGNAYAVVPLVALTLSNAPLLMQEKVQEGAKKVFTNWGGDFFKKNLDFRANTNKILEKMQLTKAPEVGGPSGAAE